MRYSIVLISLLSHFAAAQAGNWGQCGGENWSGATSCNAGWYCEYSNPWYSQCVPGSGSGSSATTSSVSSAGATTVSSKTSSSSAASTRGSGSIPSASMTRFVIDGKAAYYAGTNAYWLPFLMNDADVDLVMGHLEESGLKILRVWGFNDVNTLPSSGTVYFQLLANGEQTINTGSDGLERLDAVVKSAESHGIKLIINFVNNWNDYGGINAYVNNYGGNQTEWYTNENAQTAYQTYIKAVISRYTGSPAIFAWELANEPRCNGCDTDVIYNWAKTTSAYIKSLEPDRMVCIGDEGMGLSVDSDGSYPFGYSEGNDFEKTLTIDSIDFGTIHLYPSQWGLSDSWGSSWISAHGQACKKAGKPCLLEEYGSDSLYSSEAPWQSTAISTVAADLFWQWGDTLSTGESQHDDYTIWYGSDEYTCMVTDHVSAISSS